MVQVPKDWGAALSPASVPPVHPTTEADEPVKPPPATSPLLASATSLNASDKRKRDTEGETTSRSKRLKGLQQAQPDSPYTRWQSLKSQTRQSEKPSATPATKNEKNDWETNAAALPRHEPCPDDADLYKKVSPELQNIAYAAERLSSSLDVDHVPESILRGEH